MFLDIKFRLMLKLNFMIKDEKIYFLHNGDHGLYNTYSKYIHLNIWLCMSIRTDILNKNNEMWSWLCYQQITSINFGFYFSEYSMTIKIGIWTIYVAKYIWFDKFNIYGFYYYSLTMGIYNIKYFKYAKSNLMPRKGE